MYKLRHIKLPAKNRGLLFGNLGRGFSSHFTRRIERGDELGLLIVAQRFRRRFANHGVAAQAFENIEMRQIFSRLVCQHGDTAGRAVTDRGARARVQERFRGERTIFTPSPNTTARLLI